LPDARQGFRESALGARAPLRRTGPGEATTWFPPRRPGRTTGRETDSDPPEMGPL